MNFRAPLILLLATAAFPPLLTAGSGGQSSTGSLESLADREITRRQGNVALAQEALQASEAQLRRNEIQAAYESAKRAVDLVPDGPTERGLRARALSRFSSTSVRYAEYLVSQGEYARAAAVAQEVLEPRYNPGYRPAAVFLDRLDQPDYFNKTITPEFAAERSEVERLLNEATGFYDSGRYDLAQKRYQQVLAIDKYNAAAFRGLEEVELGKQRYYESAYNETRSRMVWQVEKAWERPHAQAAETSEGQLVEQVSESAGTEQTIALLNRLVVPRVNLTDASLSAAVDFVRAESRRLLAEDTNGDNAQINIVLKLPSRSASSATPSPEFGEEPTVADQQPEVVFNDRITLNMNEVPLYEVLRYISVLAGLNLKVEPYAVTLGTESEGMETRVFTNVPPDFFTDTREESGVNEQAAYPGGAPPEDEVTAKAGFSVNPKLALEKLGVTFDEGSGLRYDVQTGALRVVNTPANLDLIEAQIEAAAAAGPQQVRIETKFVEISQNNLKELGFDWTVGPFSIGGSGVYGAGGNSVAEGRVFPFVNPATGEVVGTDSPTGGLRSGQGTAPYSAITVNSLNALLARNLGLGLSSAPAPGIFSLAGVFTNPQFQLLIRALNQQKGVDLMAAPSVTTKSGKQAKITISRLFYYPTEFEPPEIPQNTGGGTTTLFGIVQEQDPVVTPTFPTAFTTRDLGVTLTVEPVIGPDGYTIDLSLSPEVVDFEGFINYGSPIFAPQRVQSVEGEALGLIGLTSLYRRQLLTENVINQPIFSKRRVESNVTVYDGQTVVLGGLIREDVQKVNDKVPVLGDIPIAGTLFRSEVEQKIKRNLIIFCTPRIVDASGQYRRPDEDINDEREIVEPLGLPAEIAIPGTAVSAKGFRQK